MRHTASILANGNILVTAGAASETVGQQLNTAELYNSMIGTFTSSN